MCGMEKPILARIPRTGAGRNPLRHPRLWRRPRWARPRKHANAKVPGSGGQRCLNLWQAGKPQSAQGQGKATHSLSTGLHTRSGDKRGSTASICFASAASVLAASFFSGRVFLNEIREIGSRHTVYPQNFPPRAGIKRAFEAKPENSRNAPVHEASGELP